MQWRIVDTGCCDSALVIEQKQGDNTPTAIILPYDVNGFTFEGNINFSPPITLALGSGLTVADRTIAQGSITNNTLNVTTVSLGSIFIGMPVAAPGILPGTYITGFGTGTGGTGTYTINYGQNVGASNFAASNLTLQLTSLQTQNIPEGQYDFEIWQTNLNSINSPVISGYYDINPALTVIS